ncbi:MAG: helix-turn-helix domain-containing protein, partial [Gaiellaceae bacterium]
MLTQRQREVYEFVLSYVDSHGYPPTVREIGEAVGLASPSTVHAHLANLERAGYLRRDPTKPRALELTRRERTAAGATVSVPDVGEVRVLPLVGEIAAGG